MPFTISTHNINNTPNTAQVARIQVHLKKYDTFCKKNDFSVNRTSEAETYGEIDQDSKPSGSKQRSQKAENGERDQNLLLSSDDEFQ